MQRTEKIGLRFAGLTDVGRSRTHNEDNYKLVPDHDLFIVADGMGGHASGEVASELAVVSVADFIEISAQDSETTWPFKEDRSQSYAFNLLGVAIQLANRRIFETGMATPKCKGMGTTIVGMMFNENEGYVGHVGDSRAYLIANNQIEQLTEDHSLLNDYLKTHALTPEEIEAFPHKNVIVRALGIQAKIQVDVQRLALSAGNLYVMCSDGLSGLISDDEIFQLASQHADDLDRGCQVLIDAANQRGGTDNITVVMVAVE